MAASRMLEVEMVGFRQKFALLRAGTIASLWE